MRHIPNTLTRARMALLPAYLFFLYLALFYPSAGNFHLGFWSLFLMGLTDLLDGWLAKRNNGKYKTPWGAKWDPIADKLLFWTSVPLLWAWMLSVAISSDYLLIGLAIMGVVSWIVLEHARLDITSTCMRAVKIESAKPLGRLKFATDLLAVAVAILGAWRLEQGYGTKLGILLLIGTALWLAMMLAKENVRQRQLAA